MEGKGFGREWRDVENGREEGDEKGGKERRSRDRQ